jgi:hypothetical protein
MLKPWRLRTRRTIIAAAVFAILFIFMSRMAVYAFPLIALMAIVDAEPAPRTHALTFLISALLAIPLMMQSRAVTLLWTDVHPEDEWKAFGAAIPKGAKVAADWESSEHYAFFAPQGRYLNVLDPVFMAVPHPREYATLRSVFDGREPAIANALKSLDSDYIAFSTIDAPPQLVANVSRDPNLVIVRDGINILARRR